MELFDSKRTPNGRRVHVFLGEKDLILPITTLDYGTKEYASADFRRLNPFSQVPALLTDDGEVITESVSICRYIEWHHPKPNLFGSDEPERIVVDMWNRRAELGFFMYVAQTFRHRHPYMKDHETPQIEAWADSCQTKALKVLPLFNDRLGEQDFLALNRVSVADITLMIAVEFMRAASIPMPENLTHLENWFERMQQRPSAARKF